MEIYLNLDPNYNPFNTKEGYLEIPFTSFTFKGGEPHIKIDPNHPHIDNSNPVIISHRIHSFNDFGLLAVVVDALRGLEYTDISLLLPYFPGARQDRRMVKGEPLTSAVYVKLLDSLNLNIIYSYDLHSDAVASMFEMTKTKFKVTNNYMFVRKALNDLYADEDFREHNVLSTHLIIPDEGASKKAKELNKEFGFSSVIKCSKIRDVGTGELTGFKVNADNLFEMPCIIIDDICDGGGTFLGLADELKKKNAGELILIVSHGIFSQGISKITKIFDRVYCTDSFDPLKYSEGIITDRFKIISK